MEDSNQRGFCNLRLMKVILFNPRSARAKHRIPNSILQVAASIHGKYEYVLVDGNLEKDPWGKIEGYLKNGFNVFGCTVMPGPQLKQAIPFTLTGEIVFNCSLTNEDNSFI